MLCDRCRLAEAVVNLVSMAPGRVQETHLCAACARAAGIVIDAAPGGGEGSRRPGPRPSA